MACFSFPPAGLETTFALFNHLNHKRFQIMLELIIIAFLQFSSVSSTTQNASATTDSSTPTTASFYHGVGGWGDDH